jgi:hypothetical protein
MVRHIVWQKLTEISAVLKASNIRTIGKDLWNVGQFLADYKAQIPEDTRLPIRRSENLKSHLRVKRCSVAENMFPNPFFCNFLYHRNNSIWYKRISSPLSFKKVKGRVMRSPVCLCLLVNNTDIAMYWEKIVFYVVVIIIIFIYKV